MLDLALLLFLTATGAPAKASPSLPAPDRTAIAILAKAKPSGLAWQYSRRIDINRDGHADRVFTAQDTDHFYVAVVLGPITTASASSVVAFRLAQGSQDSFCGPFESLTPEPLSSPSELLQVIGAVPEGYRYSAEGKGLSLSSGECDRFHIFWNHTAATLAWWRL